MMKDQSSSLFHHTHQDHFCGVCDDDDDDDFDDDDVDDDDDSFKSKCDLINQVIVVHSSST